MKGKIQLNKIQIAFGNLSKVKKWIKWCWEKNIAKGYVIKNENNERVMKKWWKYFRIK